RLAQYYGDEGKDSRVRILLPPGSYQPVFICDADEHGELVSTPARTRRRLLLAGAVLASIAAVAGALWALRSRESALETFWEPILKSRSRVLLCLPHPIVYHVIGPQAPELLRSFSENRSLEDRSIRANPALNAAIVPRPRQYVGVGASLTLALISAMLARRGVVTEIRTGNETSFSELRDGPVVLIGGISNQWTRDFSKGLRFVVGSEPRGSSVRDLQTGQVLGMSRRGDLADYAIISRLVNSQAGQALVIAAGLRPEGTRAAGEFLTDPALLERALGMLPAGSSRKNLQFVIQTDLVGETPGPPRVIAAHSW
ncbi:MAG: hypothetical protein M1482_15895, partial [Chloroflexi bacterium]|nr:hypothetical protein [Chloroflexota bacterium]